MRDIISDFLENKGLYEPQDFGAKHHAIARTLCYGNVSIDLYCLNCKDHSVFTMNNISASMPSSTSTEYINSLINKKIFIFTCSRDNTTKVSFYLYGEGTKIMKVGQYPSHMDVSLIIPPKYSDLLASYAKEYRSALILGAHGFYVGAFAHLRRVIENLLDTAVNKAVTDGKYKKEELIQSRVGDRIHMLSAYLPIFFVHNVPLYGIISKGIHELSEDECREFFPVLKAAIEITLEQEIERQNTEAKIKSVQGSIGRIAGLLGSKKPE